MAPSDTPTPRRGGMAGGFFLALSLVIGIVVGTIYREPSIGLVAGFGVGILLLALIWLLDRRRLGGPG